MQRKPRLEKRKNNKIWVKMKILSAGKIIYTLCDSFIIINELLNAS